jgi:MFS family permease
MANLSTLASGFSCLADRKFAVYMVANGFSLAGFWVHKVAAGWLTWDLTHSGTWLGIIAFADLFPITVLSPVAGVVADRVDRRYLSIVSQLLAMVQALALATLVLGGWIGIWSLLGLTVFLGIVYSFNTAARLAMLPNIVRPQHIASAIALNSTIFSVARFVGPALAGWIIAVGNVGIAFLFNAITFVFYVLALMRTPVLRDERAKRGAGGILRQSTEGFRYARAHPGIGPMLVLLTAMAIGVKCVLELLPGFADAVYGRGATGLAQLTSAGGAGALVAASWLVVRGGVSGLTTETIASLLAGALAVGVIASTDIFSVGLAAAFLVGIAITIAGTGTQTLMQNVVEGTMRGRVMSLYGVIYRGGPAVGALAMGSLSELVGLQWSVAGGAGVALAAWIWLQRRRRQTAVALESTPSA